MDEIVMEILKCETGQEEMFGVLLEKIPVDCIDLILDRLESVLQTISISENTLIYPALLGFEVIIGNVNTNKNLQHSVGTRIAKILTLLQTLIMETESTKIVLQSLSITTKLVKSLVTDY